MIDDEMLAIILKNRFPWLGTEDSADGADVVQELADWYEELTEERK